MYVHPFVHTYVQTYISGQQCQSPWGYIHNTPSGIPTHRKATYVLHTHMYTHTHIHTYTYTYICVYICTYIHTYVHIGGNLQEAAGKFLELTQLGSLWVTYICIQVPPWHHQCEEKGTFGTCGPQHLAKTLSARQARTCVYIVPICVLSEQNLSFANKGPK